MIKFVFNPQAPVAQKVPDEVVFRRFGGEGVEFFKSDLKTFEARLLENTNLSPSELNTLKKFCFDQEVRKKNCQFQIELWCSQC